MLRPVQALPIIGWRDMRHPVSLMLWVRTELSVVPVFFTIAM
jgi:hypothetical protein